LTVKGSRRVPQPQGFCETQLERLAPLWERMLAHPFLVQTREGTIPHDTFAAWMRQDYLFVEAAIPFLAALIPKGPAAHWEPMTQAIGALIAELRLFEERAAAVGVQIEGSQPAFTTHAYIQFLLATAQNASYEEAYTVLYAAEKAYHDSWRVVRKGLDRSSPWWPFVENWAGETFAAYVDYLETELDELAREAGPERLHRMTEAFETTVRYEVAFWEMAMTGEDWPGLPSPG
jgi:thiaminase/transcriptional activator TenA